MSNARNITAALMALSLTSASAGAWANTAQTDSSDQRAGAFLAANCANCHGTGGVSVSGLPSLAGLPKSDFVSQMRAFRDGKRSSTIMHQIAKGYTDQQYELMGDYFARQIVKATK